MHLDYEMDFFLSYNYVNMDSFICLFIFSNCCYSTSCSYIHHITSYLRHSVGIHAGLVASSIAMHRTDKFMYSFSPRDI